MNFRALALLVMLSLVAVQVHAFGTVSGNVMDASSQPMPGVSVQFYKLTTGDAVSKTGTTDTIGNYTVSGLTAGSYKVIFYGRNSSAPYIQKWFNNASSYATATAITVTDNATTSSVNAVLGAVAQPRLDIGSVTNAAPGTIVKVPVTLTTGGAAISAISTTISFEGPKLWNVTCYDPVTQTPSLGAVATAAKKSSSESIPTPDSYTIGIYSSSNTNVIGDGVVVNLFFEIAPDATGPITLTSAPSASDPTGMTVPITGASGSISF